MPATNGSVSLQLRLDVPANARVADAPVSYPFLWDAPQHDWVQWNGAVPNATVLAGRIKIGALGRNVGEYLAKDTDPQRIVQAITFGAPKHEPAAVG